MRENTSKREVKREMTTEEFLSREREEKLGAIRKEYEQEKKLLDLPIVTREIFRRANAYKTALDAADGKPITAEWAEEALTFLYEEYGYYNTCLGLSEEMEWAQEYQERQELIAFMIALIEGIYQMKNRSEKERGRT